MTEYAVIENTPGYLPESDPIYCESIEDAKNVASELADQLREAGYDRMDAGPHLQRFTRPDPYDPGYGAERVVEIQEVPHGT